MLVSIFLLLALHFPGMHTALACMHPCNTHMDSCKAKGLHCQALHECIATEAKAAKNQTCLDFTECNVRHSASYCNEKFHYKDCNHGKPAEKCDAPKAEAGKTPPPATSP